VTPAAILNELQTRGVVLSVEGGALRYRAPKGAITPELRQALVENKRDIVTALASGKAANTARRERGTLGNVPPPEGQPCRRVSADTDLTDGVVAAVLLKSAVLGGALVWLVADDETLAEHPDIICAGLPVFFFDELEQLRGKTLAELQAIGMVKAVFRTGRVLQ
jgi:hypothetical protein